MLFQISKDIFGPKFKDFCFYTKLSILINSRVMILNMTTVFQNFSLIMPIYGILLPNLMFFCCARVLYLNKFESADVKYDNNFFKILIQKFPRKAFLVPNFRIVFFFCLFHFFHETLPRDKFKIANIKYNNSFPNEAQKYLFFHKFLYLHRFESADFKYDKIFFEF